MGRLILLEKWTRAIRRLFREETCCSTCGAPLNDATAINIQTLHDDLSITCIHRCAACEEIIQIKCYHALDLS